MALYSKTIAQRVECAFRELDGSGKVVMPMDIARLAKISKTTTSNVLHDAPWWDEAHRKAARKEVSRRVCACRKARAELRVKDAFEALELKGVPYTQRDISYVSGISEGAVSRILTRMTWWTSDRKDKSIAEGRRRSNEGARKAGWPYLGMAISHSRQSVMGYPVLAMYRASFAEQGWPNLQKGREIQRIECYPNLKAALIKSHELGYPGVKASHAKQKETDYRGTRRANESRTQQKLPTTHPQVQRGERIRYNILKVIMEINNGIAQRPKYQKTGTNFIACQVGITAGKVRLHLRRLQQERIIDKHNHPLIDLAVYLSQELDQPKD